MKHQKRMLFLDNIYLVRPLTNQKYLDVVCSLLCTQYGTFTHDGKLFEIEAMDKKAPGNLIKRIRQQNKFEMNFDENDPNQMLVHELREVRMINWTDSAGILFTAFKTSVVESTFFIHTHHFPKIPARTALSGVTSQPDMVSWVFHSDINVDINTL